jgi:hypothetical protein
VLCVALRGIVSGKPLATGPHQGETTPAAPEPRSGRWRHNRLGAGLARLLANHGQWVVELDSTQRPTPPPWRHVDPLDAWKPEDWAMGRVPVHHPVREHGTLWRGLYRADPRSTIPAAQTAPLMEDT